MVPFLVLLPLVESNDVTTMGAMDLLSQLGPTALQTIGSLGLLLLGGRTVLRRVFQVRRQASIAGRQMHCCALVCPPPLFVKMAVVQQLWPDRGCCSSKAAAAAAWPSACK